jgi:hypothetical protein
MIVMVPHGAVQELRAYQTPTIMNLGKYSASVAACFLTVSLAQAQSPQISLGAELLLPIGDLAESASLGYGPSIGFEYPTSARSSVTFQLAYDFLTPKDDEGDAVDSWTYMPIQLGGKWYFMEEQAGFYGALQAGLHNVVYKTNEIELGPVLGTIPAQTETEAYFSWAIGAGYQLEKLDLGVRYNSLVDDIGNRGYFAFRLAYLFNLGG